MILETSILVADEDTEAKKTRSSILSEEEYSVEVAGNCKQAIKVCERLSFDAILIDIELADMK